MKILVIEESEYSLKLMKTILAKWNIPGEFFSNPRDALRFFKPGQFDLLITNFGKNGEGSVLIQRVKKIQPKIKVVCLTGYAIPEVEAICVKAGCDSFMGKPIDLNRLKAEIEKLSG